MKLVSKVRNATGERLDKLCAKRWLMPVILLAGAALSFLIPGIELLDPYVQIVLMYVGINIILTVSLNLVNGYMGEFSVGHAGFMAVGAYTASLLTVSVFPQSLSPWLFPIAILAGGLLAAISGLIVAIPSFETRGDYLAIITLAFLMIVKSVIENISAIGGPRGFIGMEKLTTMPWVFAWTVVSVWAIRNFVYSRFGRGVLAIREDEIVCSVLSVNTRHVKLLAFVISAFFTGIAGGLFAHLLQFVSPRTFDILKSTDMLVMVYLGGVGSIAGSILGATVFTVLIELLSPLGLWRMVFMPLMLVFLMLFRPRGIMGYRESRLIAPADASPLIPGSAPAVDNKAREEG